MKLQPALSACLGFLLTFSFLFFNDAVCEWIVDRSAGKPLPPLFWFCEAFTPVGPFWWIMPCLAGWMLWRRPADSAAWGLTAFGLFLVLLTGGMAIRPHTYLNGIREASWARHAVNTAAALVLLLSIWTAPRKQRA